MKRIRTNEEEKHGEEITTNPEASAELLVAMAKQKKRKVMLQYVPLDFPQKNRLLLKKLLQKFHRGKKFPLPLSKCSFASAEF